MSAHGCRAECGWLVVSFGDSLLITPCRRGSWKGLGEANLLLPMKPAASCGACPGSLSLSQPDSNLDADYLPAKSGWMKPYLPRCEGLAFQKESANGPC